MATFHSKHHTFLIGKESTFGTAVTADKDIGLVQSFTPSDKRNLEEIYASGSREIQQIVASNAVFDWDIEVNMQNGRLLEYVFGTVAHTLTSSDTKHTFSVATTLPSFTMESSFNSSTDEVFIYDGSKINSANINLDTNGLLKMKCSGSSQSTSTATASASAAVISSLEVLHFKHATLSTGTAASESSVGQLQTFNLNIENGLIPVPSAGTFVAQELIGGNFKMAFDFTMAFENQTEYEIFLGGTTAQQNPTAKSAVFNANNGVTLGSGRREFEIQLNDFLYEEASLPVNVGEMIIGSFKGTATNLGNNGCFYVDNITAASFS